MERTEWFAKLVEHVEFHFSMCGISWIGANLVKIVLNPKWIKHGFEPVEVTIEMADQLNIYLGKVPRPTKSVFIYDYTEGAIDEGLGLIKTVASQGLAILKQNHDRLIAALGIAQENLRTLEEILEG